MRFFQDRLAVTGLAAALALMIGSAVFDVSVPREEFRHTHIEAAIQMREYADTAKGLVAGYNYHLLERFAADNGCSVNIRIPRKDENYLDSLAAGRIDLLVIALTDSIPSGGFIVSGHVDSISRWVAREGENALVGRAEEWLEVHLADPGHRDLRERFLQTYIPAKRARTGKKYTYLSPYDELIKANADSIHWDWHLLAAVVYQESKFRTDVRSRRGAEGLMQMMPRTAGHFEVEDPFNPSMNIAAGAKYLGILERMYYKVTSDPVERKKYTLAAYNAGQGRIQDCINLAQLRGRDISRWEETASVIPEMNDDAILQVDTVKLGKFKGVETLEYVESVLSLYESFIKICP